MMNACEVEMETIGILIADDHQMFVEGLAAILAGSGDIHVLGTATNGVEAIAMAEGNPDADVLVIDLRMPVMDGIQAIRAIRRCCPAMNILALTTDADSGSITRALKAGVQGYIVKNSSKDEFIGAIRAIAGGERYFSDSLKEALILSLQGNGQKVLGGEIAVSDREKEILGLIAREYTTNEIAGKLFLSPYTVETHRKNLIHKLGVKNTAGLVRVAIQMGLLDDDE